ncbi:hypothetical protein BB559_007006 [Furculomyces boomerangus]|uniref:GDT1 family protein n=2 Tax=Harpellales TaxID=61421 RepID=A0A2T9XZE2_9FUNG|nr:hypothetical protein BB559_007006 [Furculomyces boomerangus]PWA01240.1 hypothetical protein BB558_002683 [Smittium angustum]
MYTKQNFKKCTFLILLLALSLVATASSAPSSYSDDNTTKESYLEASQSINSAKSNNGTQFKESVTQSFLVVLFSEIGDKTFLIAAILAMKHPRFIIFSASCAALWLMSLLSAVVGNFMINFISQAYVSLIASITFIAFGIKMIMEAREMKNDVISDEINSIQEELNEQFDSPSVSEEKLQMSESLSNLSNKLEAGTLPMSKSTTALDDLYDHAVKVDDLESQLFSSNKSTRFGSKVSTSIHNLFSLLLTPIFVQVFIMMFLAEWGDRSQLATIALGASREILSVTLGTIIGHTLCTGVAVIGGRYLAEKISVKILTYIGGVLFFIFGILYYKDFTTPIKV